jgi:hypothetical protein
LQVYFANKRLMPTDSNVPYTMMSAKSVRAANDTDWAPTNVKESSWAHCQLCAQLFP